MRPDETGTRRAATGRVDRGAAHRRPNLTAHDIWLQKLLYPVYRWPGIALAVSPVIVASAAALRDGVFAPAPAALAMMLGWLMQLGGVLAGVYQNLREEPEDGEHPDLVRAVQDGRLRLQSVKYAAWGCFTVVLLACVLLFLIAGIGVFVFAFAGIAAAWAYSSGPLPLGKAGAADPLFFALFGIVAVSGSYYLQAAPSLATDPSWVVVSDAMPLGVAALGVPVGALATTLLINDDIRDRDFDRQKGKRTLTVRFGLFWGRVELAAFLALAYCSLFWFWLAEEWPVRVLLPLCTLPLAVRAARLVFVHDTYRDLLPAKRYLARVMLLFSLLFAIGLATSP